MDRETNVNDCLMLHFNCHPTLASEVTTCFSCAHSHSLDSLKCLTSLPSVNITVSLHIHITLLAIVCDTVPTLIAVLRGILCCDLSRAALKRGNHPSSCEPYCGSKIYFPALIIYPVYWWLYLKTCCLVFSQLKKDKLPVKRIFLIIWRDYTDNAYQHSSSCFYAYF